MILHVALIVKDILPKITLDIILHNVVAKKDLEQYKFWAEKL